MRKPTSMPVSRRGISSMIFGQMARPVGVGFFQCQVFERQRPADLTVSAVVAGGRDVPKAAWLLIVGRPRQRRPVSIGNKGEFRDRMDHPPGAPPSRYRVPLIRRPNASCPHVLFAFKQQPLVHVVGWHADAAWIRI
jgi:hypothetical protein